MTGTDGRSAGGGRVVALDYGSARCGVAVSDPTGTLATPLDVVAAPEHPQGLQPAARRDPGAASRRASSSGCRSRSPAATPRRRPRRARSPSASAPSLGAPGRALRRALHDRARAAAAGHGGGGLARRGGAAGGVAARPETERRSRHSTVKFRARFGRSMRQPFPSCPFRHGYLDANTASRLSTHRPSRNAAPARAGSAGRGRRRTIRSTPCSSRSSAAGSSSPTVRAPSRSGPSPPSCCSARRRPRRSGTRSSRACSPGR